MKMQGSSKRVDTLLIAGPTASGKSRLALALAQEADAEVLNADALQVYADWRVLTARPDLAEASRAPHRLYGHVDGATPDYSVGRWLREATAACAAARADGRPVIIVGGAGLYFAAATEGLAEIPAIPPRLHGAIAAEAETDPTGAAARLSAIDPETAALIDLQNPRRVARALEVIEATGRGLARWRAETPPPLLAPGSYAAIRIAPDRARLRARIAARFEIMVEEGALEEVARMEARGLPPDLPARQALGAAELAAHLRGELSRAEAVAAAVTATRQYAKRQDSWARRRMSDWRALSLEEAGEGAQNPRAFLATLSNTLSPAPHA